MDSAVRQCPLCDAAPTPQGSRHSEFSGRDFHYGVCPNCGLGLVTDPREDYEALYGEEYYLGRGADPTVSYIQEMSDRQTIRNLEWAGLTESLKGLDKGSRILDFGCGLGGLVRHLRAEGWDADGFEDEGFARSWMLDHSIPVVSELAPASYDVVYAVEVMEHIADPVPALEAIRRTLKPGGHLIITTGNFARARKPLSEWTYASVPEVHITFWTPSSWDKALVAAGLRPETAAGLSPAITQYKILKSLPSPAQPLSRAAGLWRPLAKAVDARFGVSEFSHGVAA